MHRCHHFAFVDNDQICVYNNKQLVCAIPVDFYVTHLTQHTDNTITANDQTWIWGQKEQTVLSRNLFPCLDIVHHWPYVTVEGHTFHGQHCIEINQLSDEKEWVEKLAQTLPFLCKDVWTIVVSY